MGSLWMGVAEAEMEKFARDYIRVRQPDGSYAFKKLKPEEAKIRTIPAKHVPAPSLPETDHFAALALMDTYSTAAMDNIDCGSCDSGTCGCD